MCRFQQERGAPLPPLPPPGGPLPALPQQVPGRVPLGDLPTLAELRAAVSAQALQGLPAEVWQLQLLSQPGPRRRGDLHLTWQVHWMRQIVPSQFCWLCSCMSGVWQVASAAAYAANPWPASLALP